MDAIAVVLDGEEHRMVSTDECDTCWQGYPHVHEDCGGLIHADFGDESWNGDYWLRTLCERCGESE